MTHRLRDSAGDVKTALRMQRVRAAEKSVAHTWSSFTQLVRGAEISLDGHCEFLGLVASAIRDVNMERTIVAHFIGRLIPVTAAIHCWDHFEAAENAI